MSSTRRTPEHRRPGRVDRPPQLDPDAERVRARLRATQGRGEREQLRELAPGTVEPQRRP